MVMRQTKTAAMIALAFPQTFDRIGNDRIVLGHATKYENGNDRNGSSSHATSHWNDNDRIVHGHETNQNGGNDCIVSKHATNHENGNVCEDSSSATIYR